MTSIRRPASWATTFLILVAACSSSPQRGDSAPSSSPVSSGFSTTSDTTDGSTTALDPPVDDQDSTEGSAPDADVNESVPVAPDALCDQIDRATLVRERSVPGGRQLHLALSDDQSSAVAASGGSCLSFTDDRLGPLDTASGVSEAGPGATLIVARWSPDEAEASRAVIDEFVATRPADETIAVWAWSDELVQVVGATTDRGRIDRRVAAVWAADEAEPLDVASAGEQAAEEWEQIGDGALLGARSIVFVAPSLDLTELPDIDRDVITDFWIVSGATDAEDRRFDAGDPTGSVTEIAQRIDSLATAGLAVVGFCDDGGDLDIEIASKSESGGTANRRLSIGDAADEHVGLACAPDAAVAAGPDTGPAQPTLDVTFTAAQRAEYDAAGAAADLTDGRDRATGSAPPDLEWTGTVSYDSTGAAAPFVADFRGQSTIACDRRSWSIDFDGGDARHVMESSGTDEFVLVSMCADEGYVNQLTGEAAMRQFGLWNLETTTAQLRLDGESRGVYLAVEHLDDELRNDRSRVTSIIRRGYDVADIDSEVDYVAEGYVAEGYVAEGSVEGSVATDDEAAALAHYQSILVDVEGLTGPELVDALRERLDLDQYLRWVALNVALGSGDYIDEVYFVGEQSVNAQHEVIEWYTIHGWDPDDLFSECHRDGRLQIDDPNGLLVCTESLLDRAIFADPAVYDLYVDTLDQVLTDLSSERFAEFTGAAADDISAWFADPEVVGGMVELISVVPEALDTAVAIEVVDAEVARLDAAFGANRTLLLDRIATYRGG